MIVAAYIPPLWRRVMDGRVLDHYGGDVSRANILPRRREEILSRYRVESSAAAPAPAPGRPPRAREVSARADPIADAGAHRCPGCGFTYVTAAGAPREGFPAGTAFARIPDGWRCPDCGVREKRDFDPLPESSA
jgi:alkane 1-monooxygenase